MATPPFMDNPEHPPVTERVQWFGQTHPGHVRKNNEDTFIALQFDAKEVHYLGKVGEAFTGHTDFVFAVSDGMGGAKAGEFASRITVDKIMHLMPRAFKQSAMGLQAGFEDVLAELFDQIHRALIFVGASDEEVHGMQATLSVCWFTPGWMYFGHIGDSRIYYLPASGKELKQLSQDDTYVGWLYRQGQITEREAHEHPRRAALQKALGGGNQFVEPQVGAVAYEPGDMFLLCTDGIVDGLYDERLFQLLRHPDAVEEASTPAQRLVEASLKNSGRDNTTALVIEMLDWEGPQAPG
jgi:serine/threonine protein phosphatase PrpC